MSFPFLADVNWETGLVTEFGTETDTQVKMSVDHYLTLARMKLLPYRGAYCLHIDQAIGTSTTAATAVDTTSFDTSTSGTIYVAMAVFVDGLSMANSDAMTLFSLDSGAGTAEVGIRIYKTGGVIYIQVGDIGGNSWISAVLQNRKWCWIELCNAVGTGADATLDGWCNGITMGTQIGSITEAAVTQARIGVHTITGCAGGHILIDSVLADDGRLPYPYPRRQYQPVLTKTGQVFIGPGILMGAELLSNTAGNIMTLYDTDKYDANDAEYKVAEVAQNARSSIGGPLVFQRGCYANLAGTNPRGQVFIDVGDAHFRGWPAMLMNSDGLLINYAMQRKSVKR